MPKEKDEGGVDVAALTKALKARCGDTIEVSTLDKARVKISFWPTGIISLDWLMGGGLPKGRIVTIVGEMGQGKSTLSYLYIAALQRQGVTCAFLDAERAIHDVTHLAKFGIDFSKLIYLKVDSGEQAFAAIEEMSNAGVGLIVVDSVAALGTENELEGEPGDKHVGEQSRMLSQCLRRFLTIGDRNGTTLFLVNQLRQSINPMATSKYANFFQKYSMPGGKAIGYYTSVLVEVGSGKDIKEGSGENLMKVGKELTFNLRKSKVCSPYRMSKTTLDFEKGIDVEEDLVEFAALRGIIKRNGSHYSFGERKLGAGVKQASVALKEDKVLFSEIDKAVREEAFGNEV